MLSRRKHRTDLYVDCTPQDGYARPHRPPKASCLSPSKRDDTGENDGLGDQICARHTVVGWKAGDRGVVRYTQDGDRWKLRRWRRCFKDDHISRLEDNYIRNSLIPYPLFDVPPTHCLVHCFVAMEMVTAIVARLGVIVTFDQEGCYESAINAR